MTCSENRVIVWTIHPADFDISVPGIKCDHTLGYYWRTAPDSQGWKKYRDVLPAVLGHLKVKSILWCFPTLINRDKEIGKVVWELEVTRSLILERFDGWVWKEVIEGNAPLDLSRLCIPRDESTRDLEEVLIGMPLNPDCQLRRLGQLHGDGKITYADMKQLGARVSLSLATR